MNTGHTTGGAFAEIAEQLREAFDDLSLNRTGADIGKMALAIGGARHAIAVALEALGDTEPMRELMAALTAWNNSLSNSTAPIGPSAVKESANTADPLGGARGERLASVLDASPSEFNCLFASALVSKESY